MNTPHIAPYGDCTKSKRTTVIGEFSVAYSKPRGLSAHFWRALPATDDKIDRMTGYHNERYERSRAVTGPAAGWNRLGGGEQGRSEEVAQLKGVDGIMGFEY